MSSLGKGKEEKADKLMSMGFAAPIKVFSSINLDHPFHSSP